jgi:hypothetical protein
MFAMLANRVATGGAVTNLDMPAAPDPAFSIRNTHYILTEQYNLLGGCAFGALITGMQSNTPHITWVNPAQVYPVNLSVTMPANVQPWDMRRAPMPLPQGEEIQWGTTASGAEQETLFTWLGTPSWNAELPQGGLWRGLVLCTSTPTGVASAWSADAPLVLGSQLRSGTYAVVGAYCILAGLLAFRLNFTHQPLYNGRKLYPGDLTSVSYAQIPNRYAPNWLGKWGYFNTVELPLLQIYAIAAGAVTPTVLLDCIYLSQDLSALSSLAAAPW